MELTELLSRNGVSNLEDYLSLSRQLSNVPRCHTLPIKSKISVSEHTLNCMFMFDWLYHNNLISPEIPGDHRNTIKLQLQYHDLPEILMGDIPYYSKNDDNRKLEKEISKDILSNFGVDERSDFFNQEYGDLISIIDMLEFYKTIQEELNILPNYKSSYFMPIFKRLCVCRNNAFEEIRRLNKKSKYKIDINEVL